MSHVFAARTVTAFTAYVPLCDLLGVDVVANGVAAIASWARRALHVVVGVEGRPPVGAVRHFVGAPGFVGDIPLRREWEIVVPNLGEVTLLPEAAVNEGYLVLRKLRDRVGG